MKSSVAMVVSASKAAKMLGPEAAEKALGKTGSYVHLPTGLGMAAKAKPPKVEDLQLEAFRRINSIGDDTSVPKVVIIPYRDDGTVMVTKRIGSAEAKGMEFPRGKAKMQPSGVKSETSRQTGVREFFEESEQSYDATKVWCWFEKVKTDHGL